LSVLWPADGVTFASGLYDSAVHRVPQLRRFTADAAHLSDDAVATTVALFPNLRVLMLTADALDTAPLLAVVGVVSEATEDEMPPLALRHLRRLRLRLKDPTRYPLHPLRFGVTSQCVL
jgi:hypothetical protein